MHGTLVALLLCLWTVPVYADDRQAAAELARTAALHFRLNEFDEALHAYVLAYRNYADPILLYDIAQCHRQLKHNEEAVRFFKSYLDEVPQADNRDEVIRAIEELRLATQQQSQAKPPDTTPTQRSAVGNLHVSSTPSGAVVRLDEENAPGVGATPFDLVGVPGGSHRVFFARDGFKTERRDVLIVEGGSATLEATLQPEDAATSSTPVARPEHTPIYKKWWLWSIVGAAVVTGVAIGIGIGTMTNTNVPASTAGNYTVRF